MVRMMKSEGLNFGGIFRDSSVGLGFNSNSIACGGIIRDSSGNWIAGFACYIGNGNSLLAELWGIKLGICLANSINCPFLIVESDCSCAVNLINDSNIAATHHYLPIINDCRSSLAACEEAEVKHIWRQRNFCADSLANYAMKTLCSFTVFMHPPSFISSLLLADLVGVVHHRSVGVG